MWMLQYQGIPSWMNIWERDWNIDCSRRKALLQNFSTRFDDFHRFPTFTFYNWIGLLGHPSCWLNFSLLIGLRGNSQGCRMPPRKVHPFWHSFSISREGLIMIECLTDIVRAPTKKFRDPPLDISRISWTLGMDFPIYLPVLIKHGSQSNFQFVWGKPPLPLTAFICCSSYSQGCWTYPDPQSPHFLRLM